MIQKIKQYAEKKYPSRFKDKPIEVVEEDTFYKVFTGDASPVFISKNIEL